MPHVCMPNSSVCDSLSPTRSYMLVHAYWMPYCHEHKLERGGQHGGQAGACLLRPAPVKPAPWLLRACDTARMLLLVHCCSG